jgi:hypothetical protein
VHHSPQIPRKIGRCNSVSGIVSTTVLSPSQWFRLTSRTEAPGARLIPAWGEAPRTAHPRTRGPEARPIRPSIPQISLFELNPILLQEPTKLILKRPLPMMLLLAVDVLRQRLQIRWPNRKRTVPSLPCELRKLWPSGFDPLRRRSLHPFHQLCNVRRTRHPNPEMNMVSNSPDAIALASRVAHQSGKVRIQLWANRLVQNGLTLLRTENHVNQDKRKRSGHRRDYRSGFRPSNVTSDTTWGFTPRWYKTAPPALPRLQRLCA